MDKIPTFLIYVFLTLGSGEYEKDSEEIILDDEWEKVCFCYEDMPDPPVCCEQIIEEVNDGSN